MKSSLLFYVSGAVLFYIGDCYCRDVSGFGIVKLVRCATDAVCRTVRGIIAAAGQIAVLIVCICCEFAKCQGIVITVCIYRSGGKAIVIISRLSNARSFCK